MLQNNVHVPVISAVNIDDNFFFSPYGAQARRTLFRAIAAKLLVIPVFFLNSNRGLFHIQCRTLLRRCPRAADGYINNNTTCV